VSVQAEQARQAAQDERLRQLQSHRERSQQRKAAVAEQSARHAEQERLHKERQRLAALELAKRGEDSVYVLCVLAALPTCLELHMHADMRIFGWALTGPTRSRDCRTRSLPRCVVARVPLVF
jgi:hypothetical protein